VTIREFANQKAAAGTNGITPCLHLFPSVCYDRTCCAWLFAHANGTGFSAALDNCFHPAAELGVLVPEPHYKLITING
jgi:hypothetical protein